MPCNTIRPVSFGNWQDEDGLLPFPDLLEARFRLDKSAKSVIAAPSATGDSWRYFLLFCSTFFPAKKILTGLSISEVTVLYRSEMERWAKAGKMRDFWVD